MKNDTSSNYIRNWNMDAPTKNPLLVLVWSAMFMMVIPLSAQSEETASTERQEHILVIASHPYPERSTINKALWETIQNVEGVRYRNLESLYGDSVKAIDIAGERAAYEGVDTVVFMFPIHWFNLTPMLKAYLNEVWFQWAQDALDGKELLIVVTAGAEAEAYTHNGRIGSTMEEILTPMKVCAKYVGMRYLEPLAFLGVKDADEVDIRVYQKQLSEKLKK